MTFSKRFKRRLNRLWRRKNRTKTIVVIAVIAVFSAGGLVMFDANRHHEVDPSVYTPLLNTIAKGESNGNYNAYFGNASNQSVTFTDMTVAQVLAWQQAYVEAGSVSSAVGRYQIIRPTLLGLVRQLKLDTSMKFDASLQDSLAVTLLERRGAQAYVDKELSRDDFAANLAKEWAALPRISGSNPDESYYASDGINASRIGRDEISAVLDRIISR